MRGYLSLLHVLVALVAAATVAAAGAEDRAAGRNLLTNSPQDEVLVVTTNLQEGFGEADLENIYELERYADRLATQLPYIPDVLLLQEVRRKSARAAARLLTNTFDQSYVVAVEPPRYPTRSTPKIRTETSSAIVMNEETMRKIEAGGFIGLTYDPRDAADPAERVELTRHARVSLRERAGGAGLGLASIHLQFGHLDPAVVPTYQATWTKKVARVLAVRYPDVGHVIGGDFNTDRCAEPSGAFRCVKSVFWQTLTDAGYNDTLYEVASRGTRGVGLGGVDFIFATTSPLDAGSDTTYDKTDPEEFYSDHRFFWAVIST